METQRDDFAKQNDKKVRKFLIVSLLSSSFSSRKLESRKEMILQSKITRKFLIVSQNHCSDLLKASLKVTANRLMALSASPKGCHSFCDDIFCISQFCRNLS